MATNVKYDASSNEPVTLHITSEATLGPYLLLYAEIQNPNSSEFGDPPKQLGTPRIFSMPVANNILDEYMVTINGRYAPISPTKSNIVVTYEFYQGTLLLNTTSISEAITTPFKV